MTETNTSLPPAFAAIKIAVLGFDERSRQTIAQVLQHHTGSGILLTDYCDAAVVLLDMDGSDSGRLWQQYLETPNRLPAVVIARQAKPCDQATFVKKPLSVTELVNVITAAAKGARVSSTCPPAAASGVPVSLRQRGISLELRKRDSNSRRTGNKRRSSPGSDVYFKPEDFVLGELIEGLNRARSTRRMLHVNCWSSRNIILDPVRNEAHTDLTDKQLRDLGFISTHCDNGPAAVSSLLSRKRLNGLLNSGEHTLTTEPIEAFVWKLSLYTSRGRVPAGTDLQQLVYLRHWPNLTRLAEIPEASRIVALWVRQPRSLLRLYGSLIMRLENILDLYTATCAIGLAGTARRSADALFEPQEPQRHTQRGLLASVARKLEGTGRRLLGKNGKPATALTRKTAS